MVQPPPAPQVVEKPIPVPCLKASDLPVAPQPTKVDPATASQAQLAAAVKIDLLQQDQYIRELQAAMMSCLH